MHIPIDGTLVRYDMSRAKNLLVPDALLREFLLNKEKKQQNKKLKRV